MKKVRNVSFTLALMFGFATLVLIACAMGATRFLGLFARSFGFIGTLFTKPAANPLKLAILIISIIVGIAIIFGIVWQIKKKKPIFAPIFAAIGYVLIIALIWKGDSVKALLGNFRKTYGISGTHGYLLFICFIATILCLVVYTVAGFLTKPGEGLVSKPELITPEVKEVIVTKEDTTRYLANDEISLGANVNFTNDEHNLKATITELDGEILVVEEPSVKVTKKMVVDYVLSMTGEDHPVETVLGEAKSEKSPASLNLKTCNMTLVYGKDFNLTLLLRLPDNVAEEAKANHTVEDSNFAGTKDYYKVSLAKSWRTFDEVKDILEESYAYVLDKYFKVEDGQYVALEEEISSDVIEEVTEENPNKYEAQDEVVLGNKVTFVNDKHTVIAEIVELDGVANSEEEDEEEVVELDENGNPFPVIKSRSFVEKFKGADKELRQNYSDIKNALLSHKKVHSRISKSGDSFRFGRDLLASVTISGKHIRVCLALNPADYDNAKFHHFDASDKKRYAETPLMMKVKSGLAVRKTIKLIDDVCAKFGSEANPKYEVADYSKKNSLDVK